MMRSCSKVGTRNEREIFRNLKEVVNGATVWVFSSLRLSPAAKLFQQLVHRRFELTVPPKITFTDRPVDRQVDGSRMHLHHGTIVRGDPIVGADAS